MVTHFSGTSGKLNSVEIKDNITNAVEIIQLAGVFIFIGLISNTGFLSGSGVQLNPWNFIQTGHDLVHCGQKITGFEYREPMFLETSVPGIFAAGDLRQGSTNQVAAAAGEGASAA